MHKGCIVLLSLVVCSLAKECMRINSPGLAFRDGPGTNYNKIGEWKAGDIAEKIGGPVQGGDIMWIKLRSSYLNRDGYSSANYLTGVACPGTGGGSPGGNGCAPASSSISSPGVFSSLPMDGARISQPYGRTPFSWSACDKWYSAAGCMHNGIDVGVGWGTSLKAVCQGRVTSATDQNGLNPMRAGPKSVVMLCGEWLVLYGHMSQTDGMGDKSPGQRIGASGNPDGRKGAGNDHLHFEVRRFKGDQTYSNQAVNPLPLFAPHLRGAMDSPGAHACGDSMNQPDVVYPANRCTQWCGCPGKC